MLTETSQEEINRSVTGKQTVGDRRHRVFHFLDMKIPLCLRENSEGDCYNVFLVSIYTS